MEKEIRTEVKLKTSDLFCFLLHYTYSSIAGIVSLLFSIGSAVLLALKWRTLDIPYIFVLLVCALLFTVINPLSLLKRAGRQIKVSPAFKEPMRYVFSKTGVHMSMGKETADIKWEGIYKIKKFAGRYLFYTSRIHSNIIPSASFESKEDLDGFDMMIKEYYRKK